MIGTYEYVADDEGGVTSSMGVRGIYRCTDCSYDLKLYYNPPGGAFSVSIFHNLAINEVCSKRLEESDEAAVQCEKSCLAWVESHQQQSCHR